MSANLYIWPMLNFNAAKYDFWPVYQQIKEFYPIGIPLTQDGMYLSYPGTAALEDIIVRRIHDEQNFRTEWTAFESEIQEAAQKQIIGTTYGQAPSFSAVLELERRTEKALPGTMAEHAAATYTYIKELFFAVSMLGPFYTILGQDRVEMQVGDRQVKRTLFLQVSPEGEYAENFKLIQLLLEQRYPGHRLVPFALAAQNIEGLMVRYMGERTEAIFQALFNNQVDLKAPAAGYDYYGSEAWIIPGWQGGGGGWASYPPGFGS